MNFEQNKLNKAIQGELQRTQAQTSIIKLKTQKNSFKLKRLSLASIRYYALHKNVPYFLKL
jgi:hypothetical protein